MKYWILTTEYPPYYGGGISTYVSFTARMLRDKEHSVTVFLYDITLSEDHVTTENGIRVVRFHPRKTNADHMLGFNACISYEYAFTVGEYITKEGSPDIVESQEYQGIAYYLQQFKWLGYEKYSKLNILITCHAPSFLCLEYNHVPIYQFPYYWTGQMEKSCMRSADLLISPSRYFVSQAKERMNWKGIREKYIFNPIETRSSITVPVFIENRIVCFGKLSPLKGTFKLLHYFKQLWDQGFNHPLHIIGGDQQIFHPEGKSMASIVKTRYAFYISQNLLKLEGELPPEKARQQLLDAHLILVPSIMDNLPYTVLEAMSWGKTVLASCQGGQQEIIRDGENGFLFDHDTENDFREKLLSILDLDAAALNKIGQNAIETIRTTCSPEIVYKNKMEVINTFLENRQPPKQFPFNDTMTVDTGKETSEYAGDLLSVVIPYYNMGAYAEECIQSVLSSDYINKEILLINDGSNDAGSINKLQELARKYPIKIYNKQNEGLPLTRNFGAWKATGRYLAFLDADDTVEKTYYSKAVRALAKYDNVHFVGCWTRYFGSNTDSWPTFNPEPPYLLVHNMINSSALVYKRESFLRHGLNDPELVYGMEDWESVISMVENNCGGLALPEFLFNYRVRKDSMARSFTRIKQLHLYRVIGNKHKELYKKYGNEVAQILNANGSGLGFDNPTMEPSTARIGLFPVNGLRKERIKQRIKSNKYMRAFAYKIYKQLKK